MDGSERKKLLSDFYILYWIFSKSLTGCLIKTIFLVNLDESILKNRSNLLLIKTFAIRRIFKKNMYEKYANI